MSEVLVAELNNNLTIDKVAAWLSPSKEIKSVKIHDKVTKDIESIRSAIKEVLEKDTFTQICNEYYGSPLKLKLKLASMGYDLNHLANDYETILDAVPQPGIPKDSCNCDQDCDTVTVNKYSLIIFS